MTASVSAGLTAISHKEFIYLRLKALIFLNYGPAFPDNLRSLAGKALADFLADVPRRKTVIVNCQGISVIDQHAVEDVRKQIEAGGRILFLSENPTFLGDLNDALGMPVATTDLPAQVKACGYGAGGFSPMEVRRLATEARKQERAETERIVGNCFEPHRRGKLVRLHSTPILASGVFNARGLITNRRDFCLIALQLAEKLEALIQRFKPHNPRVLAVSLRGSPIAAASAFLASPHVDIEIVDHMGPKQAVLEQYSFREDRTGLDYIYIGDFLIGGTELKVASSYARAHGSHVRHAIVIGSLLEPHAYSAPVHIEPLVRLRDCRKDLHYEVVA